MLADRLKKTEDVLALCYWTYIKVCKADIYIPTAWVDREKN